MIYSKRLIGGYLNVQKQKIIKDDLEVVLEVEEDEIIPTISYLFGIKI